MARLLSFPVLVAACLLMCAPAINAQDCSGWSNWDVRGTYAISGDGWIDLSKLFPNVPDIPAGTMPMAWAGAVSYNGNGAGTGWVAVNAGGLTLNVEFVQLTYQLKEDCRIEIAYSMKFKELGVTLGPVFRLAVVAGPAPALELFGIQVGSKPGDPIDRMTMRRVSLKYR